MKCEEVKGLLEKEHIQRLEAEGHKCYDIPMGGATALFAEKEILGEIIQNIMGKAGRINYGK